MWKLIEYQLVNFKSHVDSYLVNKNQNEVTLIYGINDDDQGADSNGSGKSCIPQAIMAGLIDQLPKGLNKSDIIRDGEESAYIQLGLRNEATGKVLKIEREYFHKKSSILRLFEDAKENKQITSVAEGNKRILELLDLEKEDIIDYFIIDSENSGSFFLSSDTQQKKIINRFSRGDLVDIVLERVKIDLDKKVSELNSKENEYNSLEEKIEAYKEGMKLAQETKTDEEKKQRNIDLINKAIKREKQRLEIFVENCSRKSKKLVEIADKLEKFDVDDNKIKNLENKIKTTKKEQLESRELMNNSADQIFELEKKLKSKTTCPKCGHAFSLLDVEVDIEELEIELEEKQQIRNDLKLIYKNLTDKIDQLKDTKSVLFEDKRELERLQEQYRNIELELENIDVEESEYKETINDLKTRLIQVKNEEFEVDEEKLNKFKDLISKANKQKIKTKVKIKELRAERDDLEFWKINFGIKGLKTWIANKALQLIEGGVNFNLQKFNTNLRIKIQGFKTMASGDIKEKINILVSRDGVTWGKFEKCSGGQKQRINVCGILTFQEIINSNAKGGGLDLLILDEVFEKLDTTGQEAVLNILNMSNVTTLVISHLNNEIGFKNTLEVYYKNKESYINNG